MDGNRKRFSLGWYTGVLLGVTFSGAVVYAVTLPNTFTDGTTASATQVNANFDALRDALNGTGPCVTANASDETIRVGSLCVDKNPAALFDGSAAASAAVTAIPAGCNPDGTGCTAIFAQSRATPGAALSNGNSVSWARAARACANAGKRLPTAGEWAMARTTGVTNISAGGEWVDGATGGSGNTSPFPASHMRIDAAGKLNYFSNPTVPYDKVGTAGSTNDDFADIGFRCVR